MVPTPATHGITKQLRPRRRMRTASPPVTVTECRPRGRRRWTASTAVCLMGVVVARFHGISLVDAAATARTDGITYCWQVGGSVYASSFNSSVSIQEGSQDDCALSLAMQFSKDTFYVGEAIQASWTATLRRDTNGSFLTNKFGIQELFSAQDRVSQKPYQIVFSRIESCTADAQDCDPVVGNTNLISTVTNKPANFTDSGFATFSTDRVAFTASGKVRLLVHLVLPGQNPESTRYDFALYKTLAITDRPTLSPIRNTSGSSQSEKDGGSSSSSGGGLSTQAIGIMFVVGMVAVALVAVGFVMIRKNKAEILPPDPPTVQKGPDGRTRADASSTDMDDEFAMLSNEERFMMSQGPKKSGGFLSASAEGPRSMLEESRAAAKAKAKAPLPYVGSSSSGGHHHPGDSDLASDDHIVDPSNPASMRHHGMYVEMPPTAQPMNGPPRTSKIYYNDIREDEIASMRGNSTKMASTMNPFKNTREAPLQRTLVAGASPSASTFGGEPAEPSGEWRVSTELTFDDLRPSADLGPALTLDDLLENKQRKKRGVSDSISEASSKF